MTSTSFVNLFDQDADNERKRKRQEEMDAEIAELRRVDEEHNLEAERDSLNKMAGRAKMFASQRYMRPTENYDSEPDSPIFRPEHGRRISGSKVEYGSEREEGDY